MIDPASVATLQDLARFVSSLRDDFLSGEPWENPSLDAYLEALAAWLSDIDGWFANQGEATPDRPDWVLVAQMFAAARVYE